MDDLSIPRKGFFSKLLDPLRQQTRPPVRACTTRAHQSAFVMVAQFDGVATAEERRLIKVFA
jgi:hypothetical protein